MDSKTKNSSPLDISVQRLALTQDDLNENFAYQRRIPKGCFHATQKILKKEFSRERLKRGLKARFPVIECVRNYSKNYIIGDSVAGITVGIMQIPLGMAYAILGSCPAITGLYSSFFPVLIYFFFGTSRHISQGTFAIASLMISKPVDRLSTPDEIIHRSLNATINASNTMINSLHPDVAMYSNIQVATAVCLLAGVMQFILGVLRVGALSMYLSDTLISGFTTGAAVLIYEYIFSWITHANLATMIIGAISVVVLAFTSEVINPRAMSKIKVPVPIELLAVIVGTGVSYAMSFNENYGVIIVGNIPGGLPPPQVPPIKSLFSEIFVDSFIIAVVTYVISFSLARLFAKKHNYDINANQEFMAMGIANVSSSFFSCFPMCVALSRSMVADSVGGKTQVTGLLSCIVVLIVLVAIAPLFQCLPQCVLAAIIVVGIRRMFLQFRDFIHAWKISKLEAATWMITFLSVCFVAIDIGLGIGVIFSLFTIVMRSQLPYVTTLGYVNDTEFYLDTKKYNAAVEKKHIKVIHYGGPILFANAKSFRKTIYRVSEVNPILVAKKMEKLNKKQDFKSRSQKTVVIDMSDTKVILDSEGNPIFMHGETNPAFENDTGVSQTRNNIDRMNQKNLSSSELLKTGDQEPDDREDTPFDHVITAMKRGIVAIIIDGSPISCVDYAGVGAISQVIEEYEKVGISVYFADLPSGVLEMLDSCDFRSRIRNQVIYPTIQDAVLHVEKKETKTENPISFNSSTKL
uniref:STAS domain-containing protein n=1 Tax=Strigamia maritima TaxID=126957 RepID=T1JKB9_STRMM